MFTEKSSYNSPIIPSRFNSIIPTRLSPILPASPFRILLVILILMFFVSSGYSFSISGTALYTNKTFPVDNGIVKFYLIDDVTREIILLGTTAVDSQGQYSIEGISTTDTVYAIIYPSDPPTEWDYCPTYYPEEIVWEEATILFPTENLENIDIYCEYIKTDGPIIPSNSVTLNGFIKSGKNAVAGATIYAKSNSRIYTFTVSENNGAYSIKLPAGDYEIMIDKLGYPTYTKRISVDNNTKNINMDFSLSHNDNFITGNAMNINLSGNYPNPFNPVTKIDFSTDVNTYVKLSVYDISGRLINTIVNGNMPAGNHTIMFDGRGLSSGTYFYTLEAKGIVITKKMTLIK